MLTVQAPRGLWVVGKNKNQTHKVQTAAPGLNGRFQEGCHVTCCRKDAGFLGLQRCNKRVTVEGRGRG